MHQAKSRSRRILRIAAWTVGVALVTAGTAALFGGCSRSMFMQSPWDAIPMATPEEIAKLHQPEALRADLDAIVALHERTCPNPYLRVSKESILELAQRLKSSIDRPMTRREFLPIVMEMQAGYRSDHYGQGVPAEDLAAAFARGERLLPFRAAPEGDGDGARKTERTAADDAQPTTPAATQRETLVDRPPFRCMLLPGDPPCAAPIALIDFATMDGTLGGQWDTFLDEAIAAANARRAAGIIVDIRENGGGSTGLGDALLARVTDRPYRMNSRLVWRRSAESDEKFRMMAKPMWRWLIIALPLFVPEYTKLKQGEDGTFEFEATSRPRVEPSFVGPACLLIGDQTFSAAMDLADGVRAYDLMLTIGQPTGGVPNTLGDIGPFQLPNSRITVSYSTKLFLRASGDESDLGPVRPHIEVEPVPGRDAALERAVAEIRRMNSQR